MHAITFLLQFRQDIIVSVSNISTVVFDLLVLSLYGSHYIQLSTICVLQYAYISAPHNSNVLYGPVFALFTLQCTLRFFFCFFLCLELYSKLCHVCPITVIIYVSFEDILVLYSLQRYNFPFDQCTYVYGLALLLIY